MYVFLHSVRTIKGIGLQTVIMFLNLIPSPMFVSSCIKRTPQLNSRNVHQISSSIYQSIQKRNIQKVALLTIKDKSQENQIQKKWLSLSSRALTKQFKFNDDNMDNDMEDVEDTKPHVVYDGALTKQLRQVKMFSMMTSSMGIMMQPMILNAQNVHMAATITILGMVGFFTYGTPFMIHQLAKRYVTEIIYDPEKKLYTAVRYSFFFRRKEITFNKDQVIAPDVPGPFSSIIVDTKDGNKIPLFIALESFRYPIHYGLLMGYDKPLDLHITVEDVEAALKKHQDEKQLKSSSISKKI